jgi:hypothetical protein
VGVAQDRAGIAAVDRAVDGSGDRRRERDQNNLAALTAHRQNTSCRRKRAIPVEGLLVGIEARIL